MQSDTDSAVTLTTVLDDNASHLPHFLFELWADRQPRAAAIIGQGGTLTYDQLERRANRIAHALRAGGVGPRDTVAVFLGRGPDLVCALLGVLKCGAAFAALDPRTPAEALGRTLASVRCSFIISRRSLTPSLPLVRARLFLMDDPAWLGGQPESRPMRMAGRDDPACILFTSGSSGHPKAVLYLQRNLAVRFANSLRVSGFGGSGVFAQSSPITSIDAIDEIFLPLVSGGCTAILPYETVTSPPRLVESLAALRVTHILLVPSLLRVILAVEADLQARLERLRTWLIGGEPLTAALTRQFYERLPGAVLINFYGLTEGDATSHVTSRLAPYESGVPVGRPVQGTSVYLLDELLRPVPQGAAGEIYLAGDGLFHEYLGCPELNAERWIPNPFVRADRQARIFRTGDLGRLRPDGEIEYLGRSDRMVKVRGFRVELGGVESTLAAHPAVEAAVVLAKAAAANGTTHLVKQVVLVGYVVLKRGMNVSPQELREFLKDRLPDHAVPSTVIVLDAFPLSPNGKVDIGALPSPSDAERSVPKDHVAPGNNTEARLARIWEDLLGVGPVGVTDSFFEVGGDSLSAIDLVLRIEKEFQAQLPITVLIQSPTIAALAQVLGGGGASVASGCLVPIRPQGSRPPLFCIHADGSVFIYRRFTQHLDPEIPIYGLQAHGLSNPKDQPYRHIDEMAARYIREIRAVQPAGPYHLCAFSAGGLIIFEMARQLREMGQEVGFLGLLDAYGPDYPEPLPTRDLAGYKASVHLNTLRLHGFGGQVRYLSGRLRHRAGLIASRLSADLLLKLNLPLPRRVRYEYVARLIDRAAQAYPRGRTYAGAATLFHASTQPEGIRPDRTLGWGGLVLGGLQIRDVEGTHNSIMSHEPHVAGLVRRIDEHLSGAC